MRHGRHPAPTTVKQEIRTETSNIQMMNILQSRKMNVTTAIFIAILSFTSAFTPQISRGRANFSLAASKASDDTKHENRREMIQRALSIMPILALAAYPSPSLAVSGAMDTSSKYAPEFVQQYEDFTKMEEGWQYKDVKVGSGDVVLETGDRAVFDWSGYTIGYFGRPFEAKGGPVGGAFDKDVDYFRTVIGSGTVVPGREKSLLTMKPGGVRQVIVPYGPLSYPFDDLEHKKVGPKPTTFSGQRALNFVLENPRVDRTLLFNVKLVRVDKKNEKNGFTRG
jgi:hypothetical protein